jgi:histidinol-phosphate aminotransferase
MERVPLRPDLEDLEPYGAPQLDVPVRLNTNETAEPPPPEFATAVGRRLPRLDLHRYPDREATEVRARLAAVEGLEVGRVWAANGSNEILHHLLLAYGGAGRTALGFRPGYSLYPHLTRVTSTRYLEAELRQDLTLDVSTAAEAVATHDPDIVLVAHPNNPTGAPVGREVLRALHDTGRGLVVVDEAYVEFGAESSRPLLDVLPRLVITRTFSKALRLAGLRFGYLLAHDWVVEDLRRVRLPYHLDSMKQAAALAALDLGPAMLTHIPRVVAERDRLLTALANIEGVEALPSRANFVLVRSRRPDLFDRLLAHGVLVRDLSALPRLDGCIRVTIGRRDENDVFLAALRSEEG